MQKEVESIFIKKIPYNDSSAIVYLLTKEHGLLPFLYRKKSKQNHTALLFPMNILTVSSHIKSNREIQHINQIHCNKPLISVRENIDKLAIAQFMAEFLYTTHQYPQADIRLFEYLKYWTDELNNFEEKNFSLWHIYGLVKLAYFFGFEPHDNYSEENSLFDLSTGKFTNSKNTFTQDKNLSLLWHKLLCEDYHYFSKNSIVIDREVKQLLIQSIINYYAYHLGTSISMKSLQILSECYDFV